MTAPTIFVIKAFSCCQFFLLFFCFFSFLSDSQYQNDCIVISTNSVIFLHHRIQILWQIQMYITYVSGCTVLYNTALHCTVLYCTVLYCTVMHYTILYCTILHCTALYCTVLYCNALYYTVLYNTALHCTALYCTCTDFVSNWDGLRFFPFSVEQQSGCTSAKQDKHHRQMQIPYSNFYVQSERL